MAHLRVEVIGISFFYCAAEIETFLCMCLVMQLSWRQCHNKAIKEDGCSREERYMQVTGWNIVLFFFPFFFLDLFFFTVCLPATPSLASMAITACLPYVICI